VNFFGNFLFLKPTIYVIKQVSTTVNQTRLTMNEDNFGVFKVIHTFWP